MRARTRRRRGMSLVEVMVVMAILLTLMSVLAYGVMQSYQRSLVDMTLLTMGTVDQTLAVHQARHGRVPSTAEGLAAAYPYDPPPRDAWRNDFAYTRERAPFELVSYGDDGRAGGSGYGADIRWSEHRRSRAAP